MLNLVVRKETARLLKVKAGPKRETNMTAKYNLESQNVQTKLLRRDDVSFSERIKRSFHANRVPVICSDVT